MPTLLYLHGFNSSPESKKALQTEQWFANYAPDIEFVCPQLPPFANQAMELLSRLIEQRLPDPVYLVGSSMGGFLANCLVERYGVKAVLINPAVSPTAVWRTGWGKMPIIKRVRNGGLSQSISMSTNSGIPRR